MDMKIEKFPMAKKNKKDDGNYISVYMSTKLQKRFKKYCDEHDYNSRMLITCIIDDFIESEGY